MSMTPEDRIFQLTAELGTAQSRVEKLESLLEKIWDNKGMSNALWEQLAEHMEIEEDIPVSYDPAPITVSDLLKLERRIVRLERQINGVPAPMAIPGD